MTKAQEIEHLRSIVRGIPSDSYLATMLGHILPQFERDTRCDFPCLPDLRAIEREIQVQQALLAEARNVLVETRSESGKVIEEIARLEARRDYVKRELDELRTKASRLACAA